MKTTPPPLLINRPNISNFIDASNFILRPNVCWKRKLSIVICVPTSRNHFKNRQAIRDSWGSLAKNKKTDLAIAFFIGNPNKGENADYERQIRKELAKHQDIIQGDFIDSYKNLTYKSVNLLMWAKSYCKQVSLCSFRPMSRPFYRYFMFLSFTSM